MLGWIHKWSIYERRLNTLSGMISNLLKKNQTLLDVGSGDGEISYRVKQLVDIDAKGIDVVKRNTNKIPIDIYDGVTIPFESNSFDVCLVCDVLHHTESPKKALEEVVRVSANKIVIKDHLCENKLAYWLLRLMDWFGNAYLNVPLPYNYLSKREWYALFEELDLDVVEWQEDIPLYMQPLQWIFGRNLHFIALLNK